MNPHLFAGDEEAKALAGKTCKDRAPKLNKSEERVLAWAMKQWPDALIIPHGLKFRFPDGTTYTPDIVVWDDARFPVLLETKGGYLGPGYEQGLERYRRARDVWKMWYDFQLIDARNLP